MQAGPNQSGTFLKMYPAPLLRPLYCFIGQAAGGLIPDELKMCPPHFPGK
jgi:hypothetical protein